VLRLHARSHESRQRPVAPPAGATSSAPQPKARPWRSLQDDVERAARVQRSLLPDVSRPVGEFRLASFYRPCETLGGDLYDIAHRRDCALLLVADAMGHGAAAALVSMLVKATFQETAEGTGDPGLLLARMSVRLKRIVPERVYVAAVAARLELAGARISLANAGLPHPFLLHACRRRVDELHLDGRPLGLLDAVAPGPYGVRQVSLAPRDVLLISSDGIGGVEGARGRCFEDCRLREVLAGLTGQEAINVIDRLVKQAFDFGRGRPLRDDINVVAVSRPRPAE
jgi:sigma-B regulation protein RsbU (phosphoserine phosphatase)